MVDDNSISALLTEFGTRLNEVEEKQRLIRDRALLIGENLIAVREDLEKDILKIRQNVNDLDYQIKELKRVVNRIINEMPNFARKSELDILENQSRIFQPLELARIKDVDFLIAEKLKKNIKNKGD